MILLILPFYVSKTETETNISSSDTNEIISDTESENTTNNIVQ